MADPRIKTLKIKTGVLKRIAKEKTTYIKEVGIEQERYEKFKSEGKSFLLHASMAEWVTSSTCTLEVSGSIPI